MNGFRLSLRYAFFAGLAILLNLGVQFLALRIYAGRFSLYLAMAAGTGAGLLLKFFLDRRWIFFEKPAGVAKGAWQFMLYALMGVLTTLLFWGTELLFDALLPHAWAKYLGGGIGLVLGYTSKYHLDKRVVFTGRV